MPTDLGRPDPAAPVPPSVAALRQSLADLIDESQALRTDVHAAEKARKRTGQISLAVLGLLVIFVGLMMAVTWQTNQVAHQVNQTNRRMADCTTPGGACYEEGRKRTGQAISDIIRAEVYMAECARLYPGDSGPAFDRKLEACVSGRLKDQALGR
jgi:hypothetical protein